MPQSLLHQNNDTYYRKYEDKILDFANRENLKSRFELGEIMSEDESLHTIMMYEKLCPVNCKVYDFIKYKISGENSKLNYNIPHFIIIEEDNNNDYIFDWYELQW